MEIDESRHVHVDENKWNVRLEVRLELFVVFELSNTGRKKLGFASMGICDYNERNRGKKDEKEVVVPTPQCSNSAVVQKIVNLTSSNYAV